MQDAKGRLIDARNGKVAENRSFDIDGTAEASGLTLSSSGTFDSLRQLGNGWTKLTFGDFQASRLEDGTTNVSVNGRIAFEKMFSDKTLLGYFVGADIGRYTVADSFEGKIGSKGLSVGAYAVTALQKNVFFDAYVTGRAGFNDLSLSNDVLGVTSDYDTRSLEAGAALSGIYDLKRFELHPELALSMGRTNIGDVSMTGKAYGLTEDGLVLDAGNVTLTTLSFTPSIVIPMDAKTVSESNMVFDISPRAACEWTTSGQSGSDCGLGLDFGISGSSEDGLRNVDLSVGIDNVSGQTRTDVMFSLVQKW